MPTLRPAKGAKPLRGLFFDVDGVLTDGRLFLGEDGTEFQVFDTKDGHGIKKALAAGLRVAWISGRNSRATETRARELGVAVVLQGVKEKLRVYQDLCEHWGVTTAETAALGDDEPDVPLLLAAAFSACPADAAEPARRAAKVILKRPGGHGAVREFIEYILRYNEIVERR
jgi:3-deoxy-D-manno-octulosonate 8-phosphate phosphatase (KDO 8-P phosphatase)